MEGLKNEADGTPPETIYVTGSTVYGQATGLIIVRTGHDGENPGVAGLLTVGKSEGLDIPGIGSLFSISGSVTIMLNTTEQAQTFVIPQMFIPLLPAGAGGVSRSKIEP